MKKAYLYILFVLTLLLLFSCNDVYFSESKNIKDCKWHYQNKIVFEVPVEDIATARDFFIEIRNNNDYPNMNLILFIKTIFPDGTVACDTTECILANYDGMWLGKGKGKIIDNKFIFRQRTLFPMKGTYRFEIEQGLRDTVLYGIKDVGLRIETSKTYKQPQ